MKTKADLKLLFEKGDTPTQEHFYEWMDSYWHKDERNIGTIDYTDETGAASLGNAYKKVENPNDGNVYVLNIDGTAANAGTFGKNVANSTLTSIPNASLNLGANWKMALNGYNYTIEGLQNKSADTAFSHLLGKNSSGDIAEVDGKTVFKNMPDLMSDSEKNKWKREMNGGWTTNTMSISSILPNVIVLEDRPTYITLRGANLNINPDSFAIHIMDMAGTTLIATVPNNQVQLYSTDGTILVFYFNFSPYGTGGYRVKIWNGVADYISPMDFKVDNSITQIMFDSKLLTYNNLPTTKSYIISKMAARLETDTAIMPYGDNSLPVVGFFTDAKLKGQEDWLITARVKEFKYNYGNENAITTSPYYNNLSNLACIFGLIPNESEVLQENFSKFVTTGSNNYNINFYVDNGFNDSTGQFYLQGSQIQSNFFEVTFIKRGSTLTKVYKNSKNTITLVKVDTIDNFYDYSFGFVHRNSYGGVGFGSAAAEVSIVEAYVIS